MASVAHPLSRHISDLKRRLLIIGGTILVAFVIMFSVSAELIDWFKRPFADDLIFYGPAEALFASVKISFLASIVASMPIILNQFWRFLQPALLPGEQRWGIPLFLLASGFFVLGLAFCNLVILPLVINFFVSFGLERELKPELAVGTYVDFNVKFLLAFGFAFELPLTLTLLSRAGMVNPEQLAKYRRHAAMMALIISAVITPDATLFTMMLMAVPLIVLYEAGIWGARWFGRRKPPTSEESEDETLENDETSPPTQS
ncbi:twin-arginine translocase subunit TatC [Candidatus Nitronereus thalassa]|uniref:Sec-independent protein translocase protein TatC n=1 Tax=Candidatus Nitronereus thalassa TaxID=3020898 RepID=A0ABU3K4N5_9BACT|nr:twin-arginine translocase subunit TatC [Candidatus Nitronereus thalassa]MDT7041367.1 twin-arginine translocase subunit TatC [Candidatus Nitronereus thalassa]